MMLEPITKKMSEESDENAFRFAFYCDICGQPWRSVPYNSAAGSGDMLSAREREMERNAFYEQANREANMHFNRCPICKRVVCDDCLRIFETQDVCKECAEALRNGSH